jgi:hypothetical protein
VPREGLEPSRPEGPGILSWAKLLGSRQILRERRRDTGSWASVGVVDSEVKLRTAWDPLGFFHGK